MEKMERIDQTAAALDVCRYLKMFEDLKRVLVQANVDKTGKFPVQP